jgi:hypothetical protein
VYNLICLNKMDPLKAESEQENLEHQELSIKVPKEEY